MVPPVIVASRKPAAAAACNCKKFNALPLDVVKGGPSDSAADGPPFTTSSGKVLRFLKLTATANVNFLDATITGGTSGAQALVDEVDSDRLYFHQTETTGFKGFAEGEAITGGGTSGTLVAAGVDADSDAFTRDDVDKLSGKIVYIENRAPVTRAANQQEDIKVVISL